MKLTLCSVFYLGSNVVQGSVKMMEGGDTVGHFDYTLASLRLLIPSHSYRDSLTRDNRM
jgi:hypothetical protein